jgi:uncharacterized protein involved in type VI secretion and phage assembly
MISSISPTHEAQAVAPSAATQNTAPAKTSGSTQQQDTTQLSSAALAAMKEATETPAQTAKEAASGDRQAQRLLAKETASRIDVKG